MNDFMLIVALFLTTNTAKLQASYLDDRANLLLPYASECICATGVKPSKAYGFIYELKYPNDACLKCFAKCILTKVGYFTSDGKPIYIASLDTSSQMTQEIRDACDNETKNELDLCEKIFKYSRCLTYSILEN